MFLPMKKENVTKVDKAVNGLLCLGIIVAAGLAFYTHM